MVMDMARSPVESLTIVPAGASDFHRPPAVHFAQLPAGVSPPPGSPSTARPAGADTPGMVPLVCLLVPCSTADSRPPLADPALAAAATDGLSKAADCLDRGDRPGAAAHL